MSWVALLGIVIFFLGILVSVALHEVGHLVPAKLFNVRVTQWMVGFGPTIVSWRRGETEYGIKWLPFGGYNRMIGMLPPRPMEDEHHLRPTSTGLFQGMIESARGAVSEEIGPGDADRVFYRKPWWQKLIIMLGGPAMNFVLAMILFGIVLMGFGVATPQPVVNAVPDCVIPITEQRSTCLESDPPSPAAAAGFTPGDRIVSFNGEPVDSWDELTGLIRGAGGETVTVVIERDGETVTLTPHLIATQRQSTEDPDELVTVGYLGIEPVIENERHGLGVLMSSMWDFVKRTFDGLIHLPERMVDVWNAAFAGEERDLNSPVGIVGASRIGGEIADAPAPVSDRIAQFIMLLGSFNLAIGMFNLIPLLPLDGGHAAGAIWEGIRNGIARLLGRPQRYVDVAKALPLAYGVMVLMILMGGLLVYADLTNPVRLFD